MKCLRWDLGGGATDTAPFPGANKKGRREMSLVFAGGLAKTYQTGEVEVKALRDSYREMEKLADNVYHSLGKLPNSKLCPNSEPG